MRSNSLNIEQAWKLYRLMGDTLKVNSDDVVVDIVGRIIAKLPMESLFEALSILYGDNYKIKPPQTIASLLISGLQLNDMSRFYSHLNGIAQYAINDVA